MKVSHLHPETTAPRGARQAEADGALSFAAIEVIDEQRLYLLCHPYLRSGWFTPFDSTLYAVSAIE